MTLRHSTRPGAGEFAPGQLYTLSRPIPACAVMLVLGTTRNGGRSTVTRLIRIAGPSGKTLLCADSQETSVRSWDGIAEAPC